MKIKYLAFVAGLFVIQIPNVMSQHTVTGSEDIIDKLRLAGGVNGEASTMYSNIEGDPYLFKDFKQGKLVLISGGQYDINLRYDLYANQMHLKDKNEVYAIIHPEKIKSIEIDSFKIIYSKFAKPKGEKTLSEGGYFIVKTDGKCKLLVKKNVRIQDAEPEKPYRDPKPAKFTHTYDSYFLKLDDELAIKIKNEKDLFTVLKDHNQEINKFIKLNKLNSKEADDLDRIISYYNGL